MKRAILIIPNEELLNVENYPRELIFGESHGKPVKEFSDIHGLGITPESVGLREGEYAGFRYQAAMASLGHVVICFDEEQNIIDEKTYGYRGNKYKSLYYYIENSVDFSLKERGR